MKETCLFEINSPMLLKSHSQKQADKQFNWLWSKIQMIIEEHDDEEKNLITDKTFLQALKKMKELNLKLIPTAFILDKVLDNKNMKEQVFEVESVHKDEWWEKVGQDWQYRELNTNERKQQFARIQEESVQRHDITAFQQQLHAILWQDRKDLEKSHDVNFKEKVVLK